MLKSLKQKQQRGFDMRDLSSKKATENNRKKMDNMMNQYVTELMIRQQAEKRK